MSVSLVSMFSIPSSSAYVQVLPSNQGLAGTEAENAEDSQFIGAENVRKQMCFKLRRGDVCVKLELKRLSRWQESC